MLQKEKKARKLLLGHSGRESMRKAGKFNASLMDHIRSFVRAGITTQAIDDLVVEYTKSHGHTAATLGYLGFTKSCCTSVNEVICHGIPDGTILKEGDIVNVDITSVVDGWHGDQSETFLVGDVSAEARAVTQAAFDCMHLGIDALHPGCTVADIGDAIVEEAERRGFSVVREYVGHGLGENFHQPPNVPHYPDRKSRQQKILPGMCFTVEPMINAGSRFTQLDKSDGWTVRTRDRRLTAQFEHSILMTEDGPELLTETENGPKKGHTF